MVEWQTLRAQAGFTLIELLVTVAVVAILLAVGLPSYQNFFERQRVESVAEMLASDLRRARGEAIARGPADQLQVEFDISSGAWTYTVTDVANATVVSRSSADHYQGQVTLSIASGAFADADGDGDRDFALSSLRGLTTDGSGSIVVTSSGVSITVTRNLLGRVQLCSSSVAGYPSC